MSFFLIFSFLVVFSLLYNILLQLLSMTLYATLITFHVIVHRRMMLTVILRRWAHNILSSLRDLLPSDEPWPFHPSHTTSSLGRSASCSSHCRFGLEGPVPMSCPESFRAILHIRFLLGRVIMHWFTLSRSEYIQITRD